MSLGTLGIQVRYERSDEDTFRVMTLLPVSEVDEKWQPAGIVYEVEYEDGREGWEYEEANGRTTFGRTRKAATARAMVIMGHARRSGDVVEDNPREGLNNGKRDTAE